jgi:hypothetical protein
MWSKRDGTMKSRRSLIGLDREQTLWAKLGSTLYLAAERKMVHFARAFVVVVLLSFVVAAILVAAGVIQ